MTCIATVKGYSDIHNWGNQPNQASEPIQLEADRFYFLQVIHKEDGGPDHMSVAWSGPGIPSPVSCRKKKSNPRPKRTEKPFDYLPSGPSLLSGDSIYLPMRK